MASVDYLKVVPQKRLITIEYDPTDKDNPPLILVTFMDPPPEKGSKKPRFKSKPIIFTGKNAKKEMYEFLDTILD